MTTAQVVETSVIVNSSPIKEYDHPVDHTSPTYEMTPVFKPFRVLKQLLKKLEESINDTENTLKRIAILVFENCSNSFQTSL